MELIPRPFACYRFESDSAGYPIAKPEVSCDFLEADCDEDKTWLWPSRSE